MAVASRRRCHACFAFSDAARSASVVVCTYALSRWRMGLYRSCCAQGMWSLHASMPTTQPSNAPGPSIASTIFMIVISWSGRASANPPPRPFVLVSNSACTSFWKIFARKSRGMSVPVTSWSSMTVLPSLPPRHASSARPRIAYSVELEKIMSVLRGAGLGGNSAEVFLPLDEPTVNVQLRDGTPAADFGQVELRVQPVDGHFRVAQFLRRGTTEPFGAVIGVHQEGPSAEVRREGRKRVARDELAEA